MDNSSLAGISVNTYAVVVPFVLAAADAGLFVLVFLFVNHECHRCPSSSKYYRLVAN